MERWNVHRKYTQHGHNFGTLSDCAQSFRANTAVHLAATRAIPRDSREVRLAFIYLFIGDLSPTCLDRYSLGYTKTRRAAVLVLLYEKPEGTLRVLLTTRAKTLRTHPGQTALPGGRMDDSDASIVETAVRRVP